MKTRHNITIYTCLILCSGCSLFHSEKVKPETETVNNPKPSIEQNVVSRKANFESWRTLIFTGYIPSKIDLAFDELNTKPQSIEIKYNTNKDLAEEIKAHIQSNYSIPVKIEKANNDKLGNNVSMTLFLE